jgi:hypothetical protein
MAVQRGSTSQIAVIKEVTAGTTPSTPTLLEMPIVQWSPTHTNDVIKSAQIRSHPFVDKMLHGRFLHEFGLDYELQGAVHDTLIETMFGAAISAKSLAFTDALKSLTIEEKVAAGDFNQFVYGVFSSFGISAAAGDTTPVKITTSGMALTGTLDAAATIATAVTPAANVDPFIFVGAGITVASNITPVGSGSINLTRQIDPLMLLGSRNPREFVPGDVGATGTITIPYDASGFGSGATVSALVSGFTDAAQVWTFADEAGTTFRRLTLPKTKWTSLGRPLNARGARMQEVNWEAYYNSGTSTVCTMTTE